MTHLPSLIRKIDDFYSLSQTLMRLVRLAAPTTWTMPDDEDEDEKPEQTAEERSLEIYNRVMDKIEAISNEGNDYKYDDVADMLRRAAALYKKSVEINGGFQRMLNPKNGYLPTLLAEIFSTIDEIDGPEGEDVKDAADDIIEEMVSDLREKAKGSILGQTDEATADRVLRDINRGFFAEEARKEPEQQKSVYERGKPGAETSHTTGPAFTPETPQKYAKQLESLMEQYRATTDQKTKDDLLKLMTVSKDMMDQLKVVRGLMDQLKITPEDRDTIAKLDTATNALDQLKEQRRAIKRQMANSIFGHQKHRLQEALDKAKDPREKQWLLQKMQLLDLQMNDKLLRKRDELRARRSYINAIGVLDDHGDFQSLNIPDMERMSFERAIQRGHDMAITKSDYDRKQTVERARGHGKLGPVPQRPGRIGGGRKGEKIHQYDVGQATFVGLVDKLREKINTSAHVARLNVTQEIDSNKKKVHNALKPYVDALSKAIQKKDNKAKYDAIKALKAQMSEWASRATAIKGLSRNIRWLPFFNKLRENLETIASWKTEAGWDLNENKLAFIQNVISGADRLIEGYGRYYEGKGGAPKGIEISFDNTVKFLGIVVDQLEREVAQATSGTGVRVEGPGYRVETPTEEVGTEEAEEPEEELSPARKRLMQLEQALKGKV